MSPPLSTRSIGGFRIVEARGDELIATLRRRRDEGQRTELLFANTNFVMQCHRLAEAFAAPQTLIVNDGIGVDLASWLFHRRFFVENLAGTDFLPRYLAALDRPTRLFLLGARPASIGGAKTAFDALPRVDVVGAIDGYAGMADDARVLRTIREAAPDVLFVALGDPRQDEWIVNHRGAHDVPLVIAVGAFFDFASGTVPRAPAMMRRMRLEWVYRLAHEPRRLLKRYSVDLLAFFVHCARVQRREQRLAQRAAS